VLLALLGAVMAVRRQRALLLLLIPAVVAWAATAPASSPYIDAKLLTILSPAVLLCAAYGLASLRPPRAALAAAVVLGVAVLVSDALAYRMAIVAPEQRLAELADIDKRFAGRGPVLVNEYEEYTKHFLRRARGSDPYEGWTGGRAELRNPKLPVAAHAYDLDQLRTSFVERWPLIALRRSPAESQPPSNYRRVWSGHFYELWQRVGPTPAVHLPLDNPPYDPTQPLVCSGTVEGSFATALRQKPLIVDITRAPLPAGWYRDAQTPGALTTNKGGTVAASFDASGPVHVWLRGSTFRRLRVLIDGHEIGSVRQLNGPNQWMHVGEVELTPGSHRLELVRPTRSLRPGDAQRDVIGPVAIVPDGVEGIVRGLDVKKACGFSVDWLDVVASAPTP
jgi:hypothetical protein